MSSRASSERYRAVGTALSKLNRQMPELVKSFSNLHREAVAPGALDGKTKELIALAIAVATHCDDCIVYHARDALEAGATREEIFEAVGVAILMAGGPGLMYGSHVATILDEFSTAPD